MVLSNGCKSCQQLQNSRLSVTMWNNPLAHCIPSAPLYKKEVNGNVTLTTVLWAAFSCSILWNNREFKQITMAHADTAAGSKFPLKWDTAHVRRLNLAVAWNLTTWVAMFCRSGYYVGFISLLWPFSTYISAFLRIPLDTISFKVNLSQRLCQGCLS